MWYCLFYRTLTWVIQYIFCVNNVSGICMLLHTRRLWMHVDYVPLFVLHVWHPRFPSNGIKTWLKNDWQVLGNTYNIRKTHLFTHLESSLSPPWATMESVMKVGAHNAREPVTNVTLVNPIVDSMKLLLKNNSWHYDNESVHWLLCGRWG